MAGPSPALFLRKPALRKPGGRRGGRWRGRFRDLGQAGQFALTGGLVLLVAMVLAGFVISSIVSRATVASTATATALFLDSLVAPQVQGLSARDTVGAEEARRLDHLFRDEAFSRRFPHLEIWKPGGLVAYSTSPRLIGGRFPSPAGLLKALAGEVSAHYTDLSAGEHTARGFRTRYLEIYVPIREHLSGRIIAVAEIHELTEPLRRKLWRARAQTWLVVSGASLLVMLALFGVVYRGSRLIARQQLALRNRIAEVQKVSDQNRALGERVQRASGRLAEMNERYLRHVGAELHDGPAQLVSLALLRIELARRARTGAARERELAAIGATLADTLSDIRTISSGLILPEITDLPLRAIVHRVARTHEERTGTAVEVDCADVSHPLPHAVGICVFRFVQEGLHNAFRHAGGMGQAVRCALMGPVLTVEVRDSGAGAIHLRERTEGGLGLIGLRERVESLGGTLRISREDDGTAIEMTILVSEGS